MARPITLVRPRKSHLPDVAATDVFNEIRTDDEEASIDPESVPIETDVILHILRSS
jgi:hypothetical protein